jgi:hypothetical protein
MDSAALNTVIFIFGAIFGAACLRICDHIREIIDTKRLEAAEKGKK